MSGLLFGRRPPLQHHRRGKRHVGLLAEYYQPRSSCYGDRHSAQGPYFNFVTTRLVLSGSFPVYLDPWQKKGSPQSYAFFSSQGNVNGYSPTDCNSIAFPYYEQTLTGINYTYNNRYQIISAGKDGVFGGFGSGNPAGFPWSPSSGARVHQAGPTTRLISPQDF